MAAESGGMGTNREGPTPYTELNEVLRDLVRSVQAILRDCFVGAYLQGSFAVGDFDQHSDVDFIIVSAEELSADQIEALQSMHARLFERNTRWAQHLEGSYFPQVILRDGRRSGHKLWYLDNGSKVLIQSEHCNTLVVRWVLRTNGVPLAGPPADTLVDLIRAQDLRREILDDVNAWGQEILANPERFNNRFYQSFIVLNFCRMLHSLQTGHIVSKAAGAEWAKGSLDPSWSGLIDGTWSGRPNPALSVRQPANPEAFAATLNFVQYCMGESKRYARNL